MTIDSLLLLDVLMLHSQSTFFENSYAKYLKLYYRILSILKVEETREDHILHH